MRRSLAVSVLVSLLGFGIEARAQQPRPQVPVFRGGTGEVLVDVVARDKKGRLVRDLGPGDISIFENGAEQKVTYFRQVHSPGAMRDDYEPAVQSTGPGRTEQPSVQLQRQIRLVSLVFKGMDTDGRRNARQAAMDFLDADYGPNAYYAVFYVSRDFRPVLGYTNDLPRVKAAIDRVTMWSKAPTGNGSSIVERGGPEFGPPPSIEKPQRGPDLDVSVVAMKDFNLRMDLNLFGSLDIFSLWGIINELARMPGRKSVLYFSEGLGLPFDYRQHYLSMISAANRANVSIYTIDARGLITGSDMTMARRDIQVAATTTQDVTTRAVTEGSGGWGMNEMGMDRAMQSIYDNPQQNLFDLSEKTGGFLIANRNDFRKPMKQLAEDFNTFYEVTYRPADQNYDGRFRAITVKINRRPDIKVQSRDGYFALPPMEGQAVFPFEVPLLHALNRPQLPRELAFQARVIQYGEQNGKRQGSLVFDMPSDQIAFMKDQTGLKAKSYISFLSLITDEKGQVVAKLSRDLAVEHPIERVPELRQGRTIYQRPVSLEPGRYTLQSVMSDNIGGRLAAKKSVLIVHAANGGPDMSDLVLVRRVDPPADSAAGSQDPLKLPTGSIVPTLQDSFRSGRGAQLAAFLTYYSDKAAPAPALYLDLLRDGKVVRRERPTLPAAGEDGTIAFIVNISLESVPPGPYELRAAVLQGTKGAKRSIPVVVE